MLSDFIEANMYLLWLFVSCCLMAALSAAVFAHWLLGCAVSTTATSGASPTAVAVMLAAGDSVTLRIVLSFIVSCASDCFG